MSGSASRLLRRIFGSQSAAPVAPSQFVELGDRFYQVGMGSAVWTIERICETKNCDIPHVVIHRGGAFPSTKILSVVTLMDTSLYRRDRRDPERENQSEKRRRKDDPPKLG